MCLLRPAIIAALALAASAGCAPPPYCGLPADATGRLVAYCDSPRDQPVCDEPDAEAHFEEGARGIQLVGGRVASCSSDDELVCPPGTVGEPYCITDPQL
ncbi:MAG TPA: hypothetical protein ENK57_09440 [Polyangiaceae bacterium]|nr:hypothetical protein [Polyangiaceae bacterium]